uniref:spartin-like n=1 Tax=Styela clava TaxID=7725 RepID=UPI00193A50AC|nr:spartin-like [Styela clava]
MAQQVIRPSTPPAFDEILNEIRSCHAKSVSLASQALAQDDANNNADAMALYLQALRHSENGLRHNIHDFEQSSAGWEQARQMQEQIISTIANIRQRIYHLQSFDESGNQDVPQLESPPTYSLHDPLSSQSGPQFHDSDIMADPLLSIESGAQIYFVSAESQVESMPPSYPASLQIVLLKEDSVTPGGPQAILQVGDWVYPLANNQMPVLKSANGAYMFPKCTEDGIQEGYAIGVVISSNVSRDYVEMFENILQTYAAFQIENPDEGFVDLSEFIGAFSEADDYIPPSMSDRMAASVTNGATALSQHVRNGTDYATNLVESSANNIKAKLTPAEGKVTVNPYIKRGLEYTYNAADTTVRVKNWLVQWLCSITTSVGQQVAPYFTKAIEDSPENTSTNVYGALKVVKSGLAGFGKIWTELEKAGSTIAQAVTTATVKNMEYKYGPDAAEATNLAMGAAVNLGATAFALDNLGTKVIADIAASCDEQRVEYKSANETVSFHNSFKDDQQPDSFRNI